MFLLVFHCNYDLNRFLDNLRNGSSHSYNGILIGTYALLSGVILNDLEWLGKISNDVEHLTARLQQLSFLSPFSFLDKICFHCSQRISVS